MEREVWVGRTEAYPAVRRILVYCVSAAVCQRPRHAGDELQICGKLVAISSPWASSQDVSAAAS